ncbi:MAG: amino acid--tRNA ligase-related protein, partial [bacterium]
MTTEESDLLKLRREKLEALRALGNPFPNDFRRDALAADLHELYDDGLPQDPVQVKVAGRMMLHRIMGKASFATIQDVSGRIQLYVQRDALPEGVYNEQFKKYDIGDIVGAEGELFHTKTGELSVRVSHISLLTKSLRPLPDKHAGLTDAETRYRQRYVDLIVNEEAREVFLQRSVVIQKIREFMIEKGFLEVETPMMHPIPGGAVARPFATHHNALDMSLF